MLKYLVTKQELFLHVLPAFTPVMFKQLTTCPFANYRTAHSPFPATTARAEGSVTNRPDTRGQQWWQHNRAGASVPLSCGGWRTFSQPSQSSYDMYIVPLTRFKYSSDIAKCCPSCYNLHISTTWSYSCAHRRHLYTCMFAMSVKSEI